VLYVSALLRERGIGVLCFAWLRERGIKVLYSVLLREELYSAPLYQPLHGWLC
jgi:hypothetical protein